MMGDRAELSTVRLRTWSATLVAAIVGGFVFGIVVSAVNGAGIPALVPVSLILGVGWSWAGAAILLGRLTAGWQRSAMAGMTGLLLAVCGYYLGDMLRGVYRGIDASDPTGATFFTDWGAFVNHVLFWSIVSIIVGPLFGLIGSGSRRSDALGLVCKLVLPAVAAAEMVNRLRNDLPPVPDPARVATWSAVLVSALAIAALLVGWHLVKRFAARRF
ncbi:hypothetical protein [Nitrolancea hollandica]|uniref:Uncharacterized protein n=1 Tax=Nitrolancea hollandica Lb TaxID=1129897 RepID=I4EJH2_9BACT|nr:hypothetical protein [Nitrolancea hollandica]CCF84834.1 conserved membrane hypothetical protein [Nitrolancea hollandica Lb]